MREPDEFEKAWRAAFSYGSLLHKLGLDRSIATRKTEIDEGKTHFVFNTLDDEIIPTVPKEVLESHQGRTIWSCQISPGHFKVWARLDQLDSQLGKWLYFEASMPVKYLKFPNSKTFLAFERFCAMAFSLGMSLAEDQEGRNDCLTLVKGLLSPDTIWRDFGQG